MGAAATAEVAKVPAQADSGADMVAAEMAAAVRAAAARVVVVRVEVVTVVAVRAPDYRGVAVVLGGLRMAHWEGRKAAAVRAVEAPEEANLGRLHGPQKAAAPPAEVACQRPHQPDPSLPVAPARWPLPPPPRRCLRSGSSPPRARSLT